MSSDQQKQFSPSKGKEAFPPQHQERQPGVEGEMEPQPQSEARDYQPADKLKGKIALISGGDSGIGRSVSIMFAKEGARVAIIYLNEEKDAKDTARLVEQAGSQCLLLKGDIGSEKFCEEAVQKTVDRFGRIDVLVNNAAEQHHQTEFESIPSEQIEKTFRTNVFGHFYLTRAALSHMKKDSAIINTTSVTAFRGSEGLVDYSATKGAILAFTRSLSKQLVKRGIRVNAVAPGPVWTPLIPASFPEEKVEKFGSDSPMGRAAQPDEIAPCYVLLASSDSSFMTGQVLHPNGGEMVGS